MDNVFPGKVAVMGGGSWATALAKLLLANNKDEKIIWYMRRDDRIEDFLRTGHNPAYLSDVCFDTSRIDFSSDINEVCRAADTLLLAMPSPYMKEHLAKISVDISNKYIVTAIKGIVPDENMVITEYMHKFYNVKMENILVVSGACHAEEVALERMSYLTVGSLNEELGRLFGERLNGPRMKTVVSCDVTGIEYAAVLKNVYAIASGILHGLKVGDNFQAMMVSNAIKETARFLDKVNPCDRNICDSVYLGDLLVTCYSKFSRNHNFGSLIGRGLSVKAAKMEMEMVVEGYYGTRRIHEINQQYGVDMPILEGVYAVLYNRQSPNTAIKKIASQLV